jgi:hypothetical protein
MVPAFINRADEEYQQLGKQKNLKERFSIRSAE